MSLLGELYLPCVSKVLRCALRKGQSQESRNPQTHKLLHYFHNLVLQVVQVYLFAQAAGEGSCHFVGIIFPAEEAPVDIVLDAPAQRGEQSRDDQGLPLVQPD